MQSITNGVFDNQVKVIYAHSIFLIVNSKHKHIDDNLAILSRDSKLSHKRIEEMREYAYKLDDQSLPVIYDQEHFCQLVGYEYYYVLTLSNESEKYYKEFKIPKRHNGFRTIEEPYPDLKDIQSWILKEILDKASKRYVSAVSKAFTPGCKLRDNARFHRGKKKIVVLDIKDFFTNVTFGSVYGIFLDMGYTRALAALFAKLCTCNNYLPQGAPTSPMLSNMVMHDFDEKLWGYCQRRKINYTRYADDMTFSGDDIKIKHLITYVKQNLPNQLRLNNEKTNVMGKGCSQRVTGIVVNEKVQVPRQYRDRIRQEMYYCIKYGITSHRQQIKNLPQWITDNKQYIRHLLGKINFVLQTNPKDVCFVAYSNWLKEKYRTYE